MANVLTRSYGTASTTGATIYTVQAGETITIIGCRGSNKIGTPVTFSVTINGVYVSAIDTPLAVGSAIDIMVGSKIVALAGDVIKAWSDTNDAVDTYISYMVQT